MHIRQVLVKAELEKFQQYRDVYNALKKGKVSHKLIVQVRGCIVISALFFGLRGPLRVRITLEHLFIVFL